MSVTVEQRALGRTGLVVGALGLGGAELGYDGVPASQVDAMLGEALDLGITVIDTAAAYRDSEAKIGLALRSRPRERFNLFTKCGPDWRPDALARDIDESLRRLGTGHVDLLQLWAAPLDALRRGDAIAVLEAAKRAGKARLIGYSGDGPPAAYAVESGAFDVLQTSINVADQEAIDLTLSGCTARGVGVMAKRPVANVAWRIGRPSENGHGDAYWDRLGYADAYARRLERLDYPRLTLPLADAVAFALRFTLAVPGVATAIVGTTKPARLAENVRSASIPMNAATFDGIRARWREGSEPSWVGQE